MPHVKQPKRPYEKERRLLLGYELNAPRLAGILGCSENTARQRLADPGQITTEEWSRIHRFGHVPVDEIRAAFLS